MRPSQAVVLLAAIEQYCREQGIAESTFGRHAVNDGKLVARIRRGGTITMNTLRRIGVQLKRKAAA